MKALIPALLTTLSLNACAVPPPIGNASGLTLSKTQQTSLRTLLGLQPSSPFTVKVEDSDANGRLSTGDIAITIGGIANAEVSRRILSESDVSAINAGGGTPHAAAAKQLQAAESKWNQINHAHYSYTLQRSCFCPPDALKPMNIRVFQGKVQSATVDGIPLSADRMDSVLTIEQLFQKVHEAIDRNVSRLEVKYDPTYGYPTNIFVDYEAMMADEELSLNASDFKMASGLKPKQ